MTMVFVVIGCLLAPMLDNPKFGGVFQFIQQFQGYIWPGVVAAFLFGIIVKKAPGAAGVAALVSGPIIYGLFQNFAKNIHFTITENPLTTSSAKLKHVGAPQIPQSILGNCL